MRYSKDGKININLYIFIAGIVLLGTVLFFFIKDKNFNLGFTIIGGLLVVASIVLYFVTNKREKKPYYQEKAKKKYDNKQK